MSYLKKNVSQNAKNTHETMRYLISIGFCFLLFSSCSQKKKTEIIERKIERFKYYTNDTIQTRLKEIVRTDSIKNYVTNQ